MKRFCIWSLIGLFIICGVYLLGCSEDKSGYKSRGSSLVAYGSDEFEDEAGIQEVEHEGTFFAENLIVTGLPTIIEFCTKECPGSKRLNRHFDQFLKLRPDVAVRQIYLPNNWQPEEVREEYQVDVGSVPHIIIYDPDGDLVVQDDGRNKEGFDFLYKWMNDEIQKDWEQKHAS